MKITRQLDVYKRQVARGALRYLEQMSGHYIAFKLLALLRDKVFSSLRRLAFVKLQDKQAGQLVSLVTNDIELLEVFYACLLYTSPSLGRYH